MEEQRLLCRWVRVKAQLAWPATRETPVCSQPEQLGRHVGSDLHWERDNLAPVSSYVGCCRSRHVSFLRDVVKQIGDRVELFEWPACRPDGTELAHVNVSPEKR